MARAGAKAPPRVCRKRRRVTPTRNVEADAHPSSTDPDRTSRVATVRRGDRRAAPHDARRRSGELPVQADRADRAVPAGGRRRYRRPARRRRDGPLARSAGRRREQGGRRRRNRHGIRRESEARRLYAAARAVVDLDSSRGGQGDRPRADVPAQSVRSDRAFHRRPHGSRGPLGESVENAAGVHRRRARASRRDQLRLVRQLRDDAHADGDVRRECGREAAARSVHRRRPGGGSAARRQHRCHRVGSVNGDPARESGQAARARIVGRTAACVVARCSDADRIGGERRLLPVGRAVRAGRDARGGPRTFARSGEGGSIRSSLRRGNGDGRKRRSSTSTRPSSRASGKPTRRSSGKRCAASASSSRAEARS